MKHILEYLQMVGSEIIGSMLLIIEIFTGQQGESHN
jgi:hypothetical protein